MPLKSSEEDGGVDYHLAVSREYQKYLVENTEVIHVRRQSLVNIPFCHDIAIRKNEWRIGDKRQEFNQRCWKNIIRGGFILKQRDTGICVHKSIR